LAILLRLVLTHVRYYPKAATVEVNESKMKLFPREGGINYDLYLHRKREPICTDCLRISGVLQDGDIVLDIGANIGYYVLIQTHRRRGKNLCS
jgi:hypothetical protein